MTLGFKVLKLKLIYTWGYHPNLSLGWGCGRECPSFLQIKKIKILKLLVSTDKKSPSILTNNKKN
jgi:hypothetical protein